MAGLGRVIELENKERKQKYSKRKSVFNFLSKDQLTKKKDQILIKDLIDISNK